MPSTSFSCLVVLTRAFCTVLKRNGKSRHSSLIFVEEKLTAFRHWVVICGLVIYDMQCCDTSLLFLVFFFLLFLSSESAEFCQILSRFYCDDQLDYFYSSFCNACCIHSILKCSSSLLFLIGFLCEWSIQYWKWNIEVPCHYCAVVCFLFSFC